MLVASDCLLEVSVPYFSLYTVHIRDSGVIRRLCLSPFHSVSVLSVRKMLSALKCD